LVGWSGRNLSAKSSATVLDAAWSGDHERKVSNEASASEAGIPMRLKAPIRSSRWRQEQT
jgi:hypothetical protein